MTNSLFYGDNLGYLKEMDRQSVNLIYLDPTFNSKANYNLLFRGRKGGEVQAQTTAFRDTWTWDTPAEIAFDQILSSGAPVAAMIRAFRSFLGESDMMAYLVMMTPRLIQLHRVLRLDGSLYLHCDSTASHYLKLILDGIFGPSMFRNEIIWKRTTTHNDSKTWSRISDTILFYTKSEKFTWNTPREHYSQEYLDTKYKNDDSDGRGRFQLDNMTSPNPRPNMMYVWKGFPSPAKGWRYSLTTMAKLDSEGRIWYPCTANGDYDFSRRPRLKRYLNEMSGGIMGNIWSDINPVNSQANERIGYPTQKPIPLMERIIKTSSNSSDIVLDPFCGCGTTIEAAERSGRKWIGIDITHHAIDVIEGRLKGRFSDAVFEVKGRPVDSESAYRLAERDPYEFQWWANWMLGVQNYRERKKGADKGIDGIIYFHNFPRGVGQIIVSVKAGQNIDPGMIDALAGVISREDADLGVFVCVSRPTEKMRQRAAAQGIVRIANEQYSRIQIITADELLDGRPLRLPRPIESDLFRQTLRPVRPTKLLSPEPQLSFSLPIQGGKQSKNSNFEDHLSGRIIANITSAL